MNDPAITRYLSSRLNVRERAIMYVALSHIAPIHRRYVTYTSRDGHIYANDPTLLEGASILTRIPGKNDLVRNATGNTFAVPSREVANVPPPGYNMGWFHKRLADFGTSYASFNVNAPCDTYRAGNPASEDGYILTGGIAIDSHNVQHDADLGLQFSNGFGPVRIQSFMSADGNFTSQQWGWQCHQTAMTITFYVAYGNAELVLAVTGNDLSGNMGITKTSMVAVNPGDGWQPNCSSGKCQAKREVSFAKSASITVPDGSVFGVVNAGSISSAPQIAMTNVVVGYSLGGGYFYSKAWSATNYTDCGVSPNILNNSVGPANETSGIDLTAGTGLKPTTQCVLNGH